MKRIGVFTSGGDSPGMNACIRAVVRTALSEKIEIFGIRRGYQGMIEGDIFEMKSRDVSNIIQRGGTILKTARSTEFRTEIGITKAFQQLKHHSIDGLIAIGGDGTFKGALALHDMYSSVRTIGIPGTIDNDLAGTDFTLGFDTALNTVIDAVDKIKDTAASHDRLFLIEVMGRDSGCIALWTGVAGGAEAVLLPEKATDFKLLAQKLVDAKYKDKSSSIIIVAEGEKNGGAANVANELKKLLPNYDTKVTVLGHIQRGGSPTVKDRILGARFGYQAIASLLNGDYNQMIGITNNQLSFTPFAKATKSHDPLDEVLFKMVDILA